MAITITSDPIVSEQVVADILGWSGDEARLAINSVSARFLMFTNRSRITSGAVTLEVYRLPAVSYPVVWLRATPVTLAGFAAYIYQDGAAETTLTAADYDLYLDTGKLVISGYGTTSLDETRNLRVSYTGGWAAASVPGDIMESALQLMKLDKQRRDGMVGVASVGRDGSSTTYQTSDLPQSVSQVWFRYKVML